MPGRGLSLKTATLIGLAWILSGTPIFAQFDAAEPHTACLAANLLSSAQAAGYMFRSYKNQKTGDACLQVLRAGKVIFRRTIGNFGQFSLGQPADSADKIPTVENGTDLTGQGHPEMIVSLYTGGAHCCILEYVFELEPAFKMLATLDAEDSSFAHFAVIGDRFYYFANDWTFAYWRASFADSPAPNVVLGFVPEGDGGSFHLSLDKMRSPEPAPEKWQALLAAGRKSFNRNPRFPDGIDSTLWAKMLELIYSGHSNLEWKLVDEAWPQTRQGKDEFLTDFCSQLKTSPYWPDLEKAVTDPPTSCARAKAKLTD